MILRPSGGWASSRGNWSYLGTNGGRGSGEQLVLHQLISSGLSVDVLQVVTVSASENSTRLAGSNDGVFSILSCVRISVHGAGQSPPTLASASMI